MPLVSCPDCGKDVSDAAPACIHCGRPMRVLALASAPDRTVTPVVREVQRAQPIIYVERAPISRTLTCQTCGREIFDLPCLYCESEPGASSSGLWIVTLIASTIGVWFFCKVAAANMPIYFWNLPERWVSVVLTACWAIFWCCLWAVASGIRMVARGRSVGWASFTIGLVFGVFFFPLQLIGMALAFWR